MSEDVLESRTEQRVGWLELFFDLVFVVVIEQLTHRLHGHPTAADFGVVAGISILVWMCWTNVTGFANLAGGVSRERRFFVLLSMAAVAVMAVAIPDVTGDQAGLFAFGYAAARLAMWPLWLKGMAATGVSAVRSSLFGAGLAALWFASIAVPAPARWWMWGVLGVMELALLLNVDEHIRLNVGHFVERVGLFIIIVLGESVVQLIRAVELHETTAAWVVASMAFAIICTFWWLYFDLATTATQQRVADASYAVIRDVLMIGHWIVILGLILLAAGLGGAIESANDDHLDAGLLVALCGGAALYHAAFVGISLRIGFPPRYVALAGLPPVALPLLLFALGAHWAPWLIVAILLAETMLHGVVSPIALAKVRRVQAVA